MRFIVSCPKVKHGDLRELKTHYIDKSGIINSVSKLLDLKHPVNETFQFVIPKEVKSDEDIPIEVRGTNRSAIRIFVRGGRADKK